MVEVNELLVSALLALMSLPAHTSHSVFFVTKVKFKKFARGCQLLPRRFHQGKFLYRVFNFLSILTTYRPYVEEPKIS